MSEPTTKYDILVAVDGSAESDAGAKAPVIVARTKLA